MRKLLFALVAVFGFAGGAVAGTPIASPYFNPHTGRMGPASAKHLITGEHIPPPKFSPVVGSVKRVSHFSHPFRGRAKYTGSALDRNTGRVYQYKFRQ